MQQQLWFLSQVYSGLPVFYTAQAWRIRGPLDIACLEKMLTEVILYHEAVRTNFRVVDGQPMQVTIPSVPVRYEVVDASGESDPESAAWKFLREYFSRPFDLSRELLIRGAVVRLAPQDHIFTLMISHAVFDGISIGIFVPDMAKAYRALRCGETIGWPPAPVQYRDFAVWNRQLVEGEKGHRQIEYWARQLRDLPPLELPTDHPRPSAPSLRGKVFTWEFSPDLTAALESLARSEGMSVFMILVAALQAVLHRYTGQDDFAVGTMFANRPRPELKRIVGMFTNEIVLRADVAGDPTFRELVKRVRDVMAWAALHQDAPFAKVVEAVNPARSHNRNPLFDVLISQQKASWEVFDLDGCDAQTILPLPCDDGISEYDIAIYATEGGEKLHGSIDFATNLYEEASVLRLWQHIRNVLETVAQNPGERVSQLPLLSLSEKQQLLVDSNRTAAPYPQQAIHQLFEAQVSRTPDLPALIDRGHRVSFQELNEKANQLSRYLQRLGVKPGERVGVSFDRSSNLVITLLGILKIGAAWVPLDPLYPKDRVAYMLQDAGIRFHLTEERWSNDLPHGAEKLLCVDRDWPEIFRESADNLDVPASPDAVAYIIYTSGSTGHPKGVEGLHRGAVNRFQWMWQRYPFVPGEVASARTSLNFVDSVWELFGPLLQGIPILLIPGAVTRDPHALVSLLESEHVTRLVLVPSLLRVILEACPDAGVRLASLHIVVSSGEALQQALVEQFFAAMPQAKLINLYGSTEVSADVTCYEATPGDEAVLIGRPIANTQAYILDARLQPAPLGAKGELYIGGDGLARGYHGQPRLTAERFVSNPFSENPGDRLYRTGDVVRYRPDGNLEYLGRADHQVKIRGFRVEIGEIESTISGHKHVEQNIVLAREDEPGVLRLVAYVVPRDKALARPDADASEFLRDLRRSLEERLPEYMIPAAFVILAALPLTPNGKLNRLALPKPTTTQHRAGKDFVEPQSDMEKKIAAIWREVLHLEKVGVDDNFFDSGGHSLLLVKIHSLVKPMAPRPVTVTDLFRFPTIRLLAKFLGSSPPEGKLLPSAQERAARQIEALQRRKKNPVRPRV